MTKPEISADEARAQIATVEHWYHQIEVAPGVVTPGVGGSLLPFLRIPEDLSGRRVLDIGARDGQVSFEAERRGAEVLAIDNMPADKTGFGVASRLLGSDVEFQVANVYDLTPERFGRFDLVLCLGLLYHLRNPMLALDRIWSVTSRDLIVESQVLDNAFVEPDGQFKPLRKLARKVGDAPLVQFLPGATLNNDFTNWWSPTMSALKAMLEAACFDVTDMELHATRGIAWATRSEDPERAYWRKLDSSANVDRDR